MQDMPEAFTFPCTRLIKMILCPSKITSHYMEIQTLSGPAAQLPSLTAAAGGSVATAQNCCDSESWQTLSRPRRMARPAQLVTVTVTASGGPRPYRDPDPGLACTGNSEASESRASSSGWAGHSARDLDDVSDASDSLASGPGPGQVRIRT